MAGWFGRRCQHCGARLGPTELCACDEDGKAARLREQHEAAGTSTHPQYTVGLGPSQVIGKGGKQR
jgi:hypothetical protein